MSQYHDTKWNVSLKRVAMALWTIAFIAASGSELPWGAVASAQEKTVIEVGTTSLPPFLLRGFRNELKSFEESHPDVTVTTTALSAPIRPFPTTVESLPRLADNVIGIQTLAGNELAYAASSGLIVPLDSYFKEKDFGAHAFHPNSLEHVRFDGKVWGVPYYLGFSFFVLDGDMLESAGLEGAPQTWAELEEYTQKLTITVDNATEEGQVGLFIPSQLGFLQLMWIAMDLQKGVSYIIADKPDFSQPEIVENLEYVRRLVTSDYVHYGSGGMESSLRTPAMIFGSNIVPHIPLVAGAARRLLSQSQYFAAPVPTNGTDIIPSGYSLYLAIRSSTPEKERLSWELIKWLSRENTPLPDFWFGSPARQDLPDRSDYRKWIRRVGAGYGDVIRSASLGKPMVPSLKDLNVLINLTESYFMGTKPLEETIADLNLNADRIFYLDSQEVDRDALFE